MGVERAVTRWYVQRQRLLTEIASLEQALVEQEQREQPPEGAEQGEEQRQRLLARLEEMRARLQHLGPCPKPMMG
ncbi:hypothetical protein [Thermogemmatispora tikiterensis]|uniref:Uncharacterized protein n=1 Tax=Thermogemmatispora tikiterensis TaxID=1825093 RepID=A0A328VCL4_9CHLR|nr:hypothetical protein [Thermogemmatispora tikiterensis]RAQ95478.1 hypothetical protein A4R35_08015 [Thermogemmatispora tikiterensis]